MEKTDKNIKDERMSQKAYIVFFLIYYPLSWGLFLLAMAFGQMFDGKINLPINTPILFMAIAFYINYFIRMKFAKKRLVDLGENPKSKLLLLHSNAITEIILHIYLMVKKSVPKKEINE